MVRPDSANSQDQSRIALNNIRQPILDSPFAQEIVRETADQLEMSNGCVFKAIPLRDERLVASLAVLVCSMSLRLQWMEMQTAVERAFTTHFRRQ